ncbi:MAG: chromosomal replication initiator protein DnaA [Oscillospiraceae bacterium]|nr:chromosomal replication initiator protein DnaA [Candidatus Ruminococcus equi]
MENFAEGWNIICNYIRDEKKIVDIAYKTWISRIEPVNIDFENSEIVLLVPNDFHRQTLTRCYLPVLEDAYIAVFGTSFSTTFIIPDEQTTVVSDEFLSDENSANAGYEFTFDTFIVGSSNKFAHAACLAVAQNPAGAYNPLFMYGKSGLGKTHLLYAIGNEIKKNFPNKNIVYIKGDDFTNELIVSLGKGKEAMAQFRQKYRQADVLLVDDVQFIGGKESTQEEFFHTFNTLYEAKKQIVLTSDRPPKEIKTLEERLRTRFESGLIADVQPPDLETRIAIIKRKAEILGFEIPNEVCEFIAGKLKSNIRQLEGVVKKLKARYLLTGEIPSLSSANEVISDILNNDAPPELTVEKIIDEVARTFGVEAKDIRSQKTRRQNINKPRQIAIYIVRELTSLTMENIGKEFGGKHYSSIVYVVQTVEKNIKTDTQLRETIEDIIKNIRDR